jgi:hypothetical protein
VSALAVVMGLNLLEVILVQFPSFGVDFDARKLSLPAPVQAYLAVRRRGGLLVQLPISVVDPECLLKAPPGSVTQPLNPYKSENPGRLDGSNI